MEIRSLSGVEKKIVGITLGGLMILGIRNLIEIFLSNDILNIKKYSLVGCKWFRPVNNLHSARSLSGLILVVGFMTWTAPAHSLGVGAVSADSYIGQRLSATIPIFNISKPNELGIRVVSSSIDGSASTLLADLDRANSQLAVRVITEQPLNEPYLTFTLEFDDQGNVVNKEFTLLLNLVPRGGNAVAQDSYDQTSSYQSGSARIEDMVSNRVDGVMGPYEWAEKGNIPEKFGAVLDGQSLWRVARRINRGLGVSINQMMWSLYQQNRQAFSSDSVDSLQAGSYLTIPSFQQASQISDVQAKRALSQLTSGNTTSANTEPRMAQTTQEVQPQAIQTQDSSAVSESLTMEQAVDEVASDATQVSGADESDPFALSGLSPEQLAGVSLADGADQKSQEIISSLAATVGNLTQELIQKDKRIEFLEQKVAALEKLAGVDSSNLAALNALNGNEVTSEVDATPSSADKWPLWSWLLAGLALLLGLAIFFRSRLTSLATDLNLGGEKKVEFGPPATKKEDPHSHNDQELIEDSSEYSIYDKVQKAISQDDSGVDFIDMHDMESIMEIDETHDGIESELPEDVDFSDTEGIELEESNLDFEERFERLLEEGDFGFAMELLDFAKHNEITEDQYHCERLRLLQSEGNEEGFYAYYYDIEAQIPNFDTNLQNRISEMVVQLSDTEK